MNYSQVMLRPLLLLGVAWLALAGCASQSQKTIAGLDPAKPEYASEQCEQVRQQVWIHQDLKNAKAVGGGAAVVLLGPVAILPVLAGSVGLSAADHVDARQVALACGGSPKGALEITGDVLMENTVNLITRGIAVPNK